MIRSLSPKQILSSFASQLVPLFYKMIYKKFHKDIITLSFCDVLAIVGKGHRIANAPSLKIL